MQFLGLDYSTQQLKAVLINHNSRICFEEIITYDTDLSHYRTKHGVMCVDGRVVAPTLLWVEATDMLFESMSKKIDLSGIVAISGSAQQHTTIFWGLGSNERLQNLNSSRTLASQLKGFFSRELTTTWMDSSTEQECQAMEDVLGGTEKFEIVTGSTLAGRFSGPQIMQALAQDAELAGRTERIALVSSGLCSMMAGRFVGLDEADAAGTGLVDCASRSWSRVLCEVVHPNGDLEGLLGEIVASNTIVGGVSEYFVNRYGLDPACRVVAFTGDNPSSVVGLQLNREDLCLSLGTSDTLFACLSRRPDLSSISSGRTRLPLFVFRHPLPSSDGDFVSLLCYKNGSQVRQSLCDEYCNGDWTTFSQALQSTSPGNNGFVGLLCDLEEITPTGIRGRHFGRLRSDESGQLDTVNEAELRDVSSGQLIRAAVEGQLMSKYRHLTQIYPGELTKLKRVIVTGGASSNKDILQIVADIFGMRVFTIETVNSAALGAVFRAVAATQSENFFEHFLQEFGQPVVVCSTGNSKVYRDMDKTFGQFLENIVIGQI